jgi:hypothetical protein
VKFKLAIEQTRVGKIVLLRPFSDMIRARMDLVCLATCELLDTDEFVFALGLPASVDLGTWFICQCISGDFGKSRGYLY